MGPAGLRIGIVSTRLAGTDGVSLESAKWAEVFTELGHTCFYFAGECDRPAERSRIVPEAHFTHSDVQLINQDIFDGNVIRSPETSALTHQLQQQLKKELRQFVEDFDIQLLKIENALSLPMNIPLGLALTEFIAETNLPTIAHHHDFVWERSRFAINGAEDLLHAAFPPSMTSICHVVINTHAATELARRTGMRSTVIPNVMDFENPPGENGNIQAVRDELGMEAGETLLLQPTRVVPRKCIERSVELAQRLGMPNRLVISHSAGDEGIAYQEYLMDYADALGVSINFAGDLFCHEDDPGVEKGQFTLSDAYQCADLVTYPSRVEGFGNAFLEAIYYRRPVLIGGYDIFRVDIEPKGFEVIVIDEHVTPSTISAVRAALTDETRTREAAEHNFQLGKQHYSYASLRTRLHMLLEQYRARRSFGGT